MPPSFRALAERLMSGESHIHRFLRDSAFGRTRLWRPRIREELRNLYASYPNHSVNLAIAFVIEYAQVPELTAMKYMLYFDGDPVETIMCFVTSDQLPIPAFRPRDRGPTEEYVSRFVEHVRSRDNGYDSE